ncbi:serine/threonine-protein kinase VRK1-like [Onthophagus taurus]|uniref:serine/threonine-protein kinase VRK1-like n=1 Tax=Onthophagus taurus TaxID=166361 RepID=UPI0039BECB2D
MVSAKMPKRATPSSEDIRPKKKSSNTTPPSTIDIRTGQILTDITGKQWKLGRTVGIGGFGAIFLASDDIKNDVNDNCKYVAKVETHSSGPLFVEINCYIRIAKEEYINEYKKTTGLRKLGMPHYVASGSHMVRGSKLRFLILPRFDKNLEDIFNTNKSFNFNTVLIVALELLNVIEYIHANGYIHGDIKATNIMIKYPHITGYKRRKAGAISLRKKQVNRTHFLRSAEIDDETENLYEIVNNNQVYLLDLGLVSKYLQPDGRHKNVSCDQRKAHAGTLLFCSLDAHNGVQVRRSDLESLGYNIVYWLTSTLPWMNEIEDPVIVHKMKQRSLSDLHKFLESCFLTTYPQFIYDYFKYLVQLDFNTEPDYSYCRGIFKSALESYGYNNQVSLANLKKRQILGVKHKLSYKLNRIPLSTKPSNLPLKPKRRRKGKEIANLSWSKVLMDPEMILRQGKHRYRTITESSDAVLNLQDIDLDELNPTYAMVEVYNKFMERLQSGSSPRYCEFESNNIPGYTPIMMAVYTKMLERQRFEEEQLKMLTKKQSRKKVTKKVKKIVVVNNDPSENIRITRSRTGLLRNQINK